MTLMICLYINAFHVFSLLLYQSNGMINAHQSWVPVSLGTHLGKYTFPTFPHLLLKYSPQFLMNGVETLKKVTLLQLKPISSKILMSAPSVDTTQSCEALLQNLNEDYQVIKRESTSCGRLSPCWKLLCREAGLRLSWLVWDLTSMKRNSTFFLRNWPLALFRIFVISITWNSVIVWIILSRWEVMWRNWT